MDAPSAPRRWLFVAPHPDDETIPAAGLLQRALAAGDAVHVLLLTDGEANPWPQRWLERRWRVTADDRARWGARRRDECRAALRVLGADPDRALTALGWPDGDLTAAFARAPLEMLAALRELLHRHAPTHVVLPAADDRHPDHSVCAVLLALALEGTGLAPALRAWRVHGGAAGDVRDAATGDRRDDPLHVELTAAEFACKQAALACHATQLALSGRRFRALAARVETFDRDPFTPALDRRSAWPRPVERLLGAFQRDWQWRAVHRDAAGAIAVHTVPSARMCTQAPPDAIFTKLEAGRRGPWIYDSHGWRRSDRAR